MSYLSIVQHASTSGGTDAAGATDAATATVMVGGVKVTPLAPRRPAAVAAGSSPSSLSPSPFRPAAASAATATAAAESNSTSCSQLQDADRDILTYIFEPVLQGQPIRQDPIPDEELGSEGTPIDAALLATLRQRDIEAVRLSEQEKDYDRALAILDESITMCAHYAPAYNNRAQIYQLLQRADDAMRDVRSAIAHAGRDRQVLQMAHTQRAILLEVQGQRDQALAEFQRAARLGSAFARKEAVRLNPYAAMCNAMLERVMKPSAATAAAPAAPKAKAEADESSSAYK